MPLRPIRRVCARQVFDRGFLKIYMAIASSPADSPKNDEEAREFARSLGASAVLAGRAQEIPDNSLRLFVRLLGAKDNLAAGPTEEVVVPPPPADLPKEVQVPFPRSGTQSSSAPSGSNSNTSALENKKTSIAGKDRVSLPSCSYMPNPPYTKEAKAAKFSGSVLVEGIVVLDGKITDIRLVKSPGLGFDEVIKKTMKKWKCSPAIGPNGKPIPVIVPFQFNFRMY